MNRLARFLRPLPGRDYALLPLIAVGTALVMFATAELAARILWIQDEHNPCVSMGEDFYRAKPNCSARTKVAEGAWADYHYNECGYRSATSCGPKPPHSVRIAIIGSSVGQAYRVAYEDSFFAQAAHDLSRRCHVTVDVQNLSVLSAGPLDAYRQANEALKLKPDVVVFLLVPFDLEKPIDSRALEAVRLEQGSAPILVPEHKSLWRRVEFALVSSRAIVMAEHYLFQDQDIYIRLFLRYGDKADFLRPPFTAAWRQRFSALKVIMGDMVQKLRAAGVPFIVMPVPSRAEAAMLSAPRLPPNVDPSAFGREVERTAAAEGAGFEDLMGPFSRVPHAERLYLAVDGHVAKDGQALIARALESKLEDGSVRGLERCGDPKDLRVGGP